MTAGVRELGSKGITIVGYDSGKAQTDAIREGLMQVNPVYRNGGKKYIWIG